MQKIMREILKTFSRKVVSSFENALSLQIKYEIVMHFNMSFRKKIITLTKFEYDSPMKHIGEDKDNANDKFI